MKIARIPNFKNMAKAPEAALALMAGSDWARAARMWRQIITDRRQIRF
jgi:hypothetical protein